MDNDMLVFWDGFDDAIVGYVMNKDLEPITVYDYQAAIELLLDQGFEYTDAMEHLHFNVIDAYVGTRTPLWLYPGSKVDVEAAEEGMHF